MPMRARLEALALTALGVLPTLVTGCKDKQPQMRTEQASASASSAASAPTFAGKPCKKSDQKECEDKCAGGDAVSCLRAAEIHGMKLKDAASASELARRSCDLGNASGCAYAGRLFRDRQDLPAEERARSGFAFLDKACEGGVIAACTDAAVVTTDVAQIRRVLEKGCASGPPRSALSCAVLGSRLLDGELGPADVANGTAFFEKACTASADHCIFLADRLAEGRGVSKDGAKAAALFDRGCRRGDARACASLGVALRDGETTTRDVAKARAAFEAGCAPEKPMRGEACLGLGEMLEQGAGGAKDVKAALEKYTEACDQLATEACAKAATLAARGAAGKPDDKVASELLVKGCERARGGGSIAREVCDRASATLEKKDKPGAVAMWRERCEKRLDGHGCARWKALGGAPDDELLEHRSAAAKGRCTSPLTRDGEACRTWAELGGKPTPEQLAQPAGKPTARRPRPLSANPPGAPGAPDPHEDEGDEDRR